MEYREEYIVDISIQPKSIEDIPEEILEFILMKLSPYKDLRSAGLVSKSWHKLVKVVSRKLQQNYTSCVNSGQLLWSIIRPEVGPRITERYSHCCCYYDKSLYVFGGCTATNTTLNDLWRFDLTLREWIRPLAMGTYPFPKACASLVVYKDSLVLFGGWSHPTPFPLHQAARFFSELHIYKPSSNRWTHVTTLSHQSPQPVAGHSASVVRDMMVMFGGSQVPGIRTNDVWVFDFADASWKMPRISSKKPSPRYGQTQVTLDDDHILIIGGCGGGSPNQVYSDCWLLTIRPEEWTWEQIEVLNTACAPAQQWCHPACKVQNMIITLCKPTRPPPNVTPASPRIKKMGNRRIWIPPHEDTSDAVHSSNPIIELSVMDTTEPPVPSCDLPSSSNACENEMPNVDSSSRAPVIGSNVSDLNSSDSKTENPRPGLPCIRPNAMKNRQRQLEALLKYEKKFRHSENSGPSKPLVVTSHSPLTFPNRQQKSHSNRNTASLMVLHVLDIGNVLETKTASWQDLNYDNMAGAPDETIFYSLVEGRGEILMFGGIERDIQSLQRGHGIKSHTVNNALFVMSPIQKLL